MLQSSLLDTITGRRSIEWDEPEDCRQEIPADDGSLTVWCDEEDNDWEIDFWDTAGHEAMIQLRQLAYPRTQVLLIAFDMTNGVSLENLPSWIEEVAETEPNVGAVIVVGTKADLYEELKGSGRGSDGQPLKTLEEMNAMAVQIGANAFVCTSAKTGYGTLGDAVCGSVPSDNTEDTDPEHEAYEPDFMSGSVYQFLNELIMMFGYKLRRSDDISQDWIRNTTTMMAVQVQLQLGASTAALASAPAVPADLQADIDRVQSGWV